jgi:hypothetical protein
VRRTRRTKSRLFEVRPFFSPHIKDHTNYILQIILLMILMILHGVLQISQTPDLTQLGTISTRTTTKRSSAISWRELANDLTIAQDSLPSSKMRVTLLELGPQMTIIHFGESSAG